MVSRRAQFLCWWRRTGMGLRLGIFILASLLFAALVYWQRPLEESSYLGTNLLVIGLVNFNIIVLCILIFLVGRNVVKLIFDRKRNILGSRLRLRLVVAFVSLALVPTVILFVLASGMLNNAMEGWFSGQVESSVAGAVDVARHHYGFLRRMSRSATREIAREIGEKPLIYRDEQLLHDYLEQQRQEQGFFSIAVLDTQGAPSAQVQNAAAMIEDFSEPAPDPGAVQKALQEEKASVLSEKKEASQFVRAYSPTRYGEAAAVVMTTLRFDPDLTHALTVVNDSFKEYERLKLFRQPLRSGNLLALSMLTGMILFAAIWIGFYIAREISVPIQRLAEGTRAVARGDYDFHLRVSGDDEIAFLVQSFNRMIADLKQSRDEAERHRVYIETILSNLAVGVIGLDTNNRVTSINMAAAQFFGCVDTEQVINKDIAQVLRPADLAHIKPVLEAVARQQTASGGFRGIVEGELNINSQGRMCRIVCTAGEIVNADGQWCGTLLLFDDVTDLAKAQQMAAWREVARRIAHEIKNPLTPIQLCAQRLQRLLVGHAVENSVQESTQTIVEHVDSIKRLADEFSKFARMPSVEFGTHDLNRLISDVLTMFAKQHSALVFQFIADNEMPEVLMDREQIRRALINLFDNAVAAVAQVGDTDGPGRIVVRTAYARRRDCVSIEFVDNGPGITSDDKNRIFEPYFTTKDGGTGLGLAIVTSIIADHQGDIRVFDNQPRGARFWVELPVKARAVTQRKFAAV